MVLSSVSENRTFETIPELFTAGEGAHRAFAQQVLTLFRFNMPDNQFIEHNSMFFVFGNVHRKIFNIVIR